MLPVLPGVCVGSGCQAGQTGPREDVGVDVSNAGLQSDGSAFQPNFAVYPAVMTEVYPGKCSCT
jgi:hypothetical protein